MKSVIVGVLVGLAILFGLSLGRSCDRPRPKPSPAARAIVDSAPKWRQEARDSQGVLDTLQAQIDRIRADSARVARDLRGIRGRRDSLARAAAAQQSAIDSTGELADTSSASDSSSYWRGLAFRNSVLVGTLRENVAACSQGDGIYERRGKELDDALAKCAHHSAILTGQRDNAQARLDRSVAELDTANTKLESIARFKIGLGLSLPKPPKWATGILGCVAGGSAAALLTRREKRVEAAAIACGSAATALTVAVPTD